MSVAPDIDFSQVPVLGNRLLDQLNALRNASPVYWSEHEQAWIITGHKEVLEAFQGGVPLSARRSDFLLYLLPDKEEREALIPHVLRYFPKFLINLDPPEQHRLRMLMAPAFGRNVVEGYRPLAREVIAEVLERAADAGEVEFISEVARPITGLNILRMMGLEDEAKFLPKLERWAYFASAGGSVPSRQVMAEMDEVFAEMAGVFTPLIEARRAEKGDDFISRLVHAELDGDRLTDEEIIGNLMLILLAGHDTTLNTMALSIDALSRDPEAVAFMRANPDKTLNSVMELSRYIAMSTHQGRIVAEDFEWCGQQLKKGQPVHIMTAGANRDPKVFENPEQLDLTRNQMQNLTFGPGIHHCIGHLFAKMQLTEFFPQFLELFERWETLDESLVWSASVTFRGPIAMHVRLHPRKG